METMVIGIAGGTGSGKTTLTDRLKRHFGDDVSVVYHDNYYKSHDDLTYEQRCELNYDHPDAFDTDLLIEHLAALRAGQEIDLSLIHISPLPRPAKSASCFCWPAGPPSCPTPNTKSF